MEFYRCADSNGVLRGDKQYRSPRFFQGAMDDFHAWLTYAPLAREPPMALPVVLQVG